MYPLVSVIIPAFNAENFLHNTLESALAQTYPDFEVIVVDDGSTDGTADIVRLFVEKDHRVSLIAKKNGGVSTARNIGIKQGRGQYVAFLDADDLWHRDKLMEQVSALYVDGVEFYAAAFSLHRNITIDDQVVDSSYYWGDRDFSLAQHLVLGPVGNGSSLIVRRDVALDVGGFDVDYVRLGAGGCEDLDFELKIAARHPIRCVPRYHVGYRVYDGNMSSERRRMAKAMEMTIAKNLDRNPEVSAYCRRMAWTKAYRYSAGRLMRPAYARDFLHFMRRFMAVNPAGATRYLWVSLVVKIKRLLQRRLNLSGAPADRISFTDTDPKTTYQSFEDAVVTSMYERLAAECTRSSLVLTPHGR